MPRNNQPRRIDCPFPNYSDAYVILPPEWLGEHQQRHDRTVEAARKYNNARLTFAACSIALADEWGNIPGLQGDDPAQWDFTKVPLSVLRWLEVAVYDDFLKAFIVPKASASPSPNG